MGESVYKVIELVGTSTESGEKAAAAAVALASKSWRDLRIAGQTTDGIVEAVEGTDGRFLIGVQWHPEDMADEPTTGAIVRAFIAAAGANESP